MDVIATTAERSTELLDSRSLFGDWQALRAKIANDGYVFLRGLLPPAMVRDVGAACLSALQRGGWTEAGPDPITARPRLPARAIKMRDAFGDPGYRQILTNPGFAMIPFIPPLADVMAQIMGPAGSATR